LSKKKLARRKSFAEEEGLSKEDLRALQYISDLVISSLPNKARKRMQQMARQKARNAPE
jgi:hypothetical protein